MTYINPFRPLGGDLDGHPDTDLPTWTSPVRAGNEPPAESDDARLRRIARWIGSFPEPPAGEYAPLTMDLSDARWLLTFLLPALPEMGGDRG